MEIENLKENEHIELKSSEKGLPSSFWETYSSFANTSGGTIYLGIKETNNGNIPVKIENIPQIIKSILTTSRNKTKVSLSLISESNIEEIDFKECKIIKVNIPEAPRNEKPVFLDGNVSDSYIRIGGGDHKASFNEIRSMLIDNSEENYDYLPNKMNLGFESINIETLKTFRKMYEAVHPYSYYSSMDDESFLKSIGSIAKNGNGNEVLTNASLLMFGNYFKITSVFGNYMLDYREADSFSDKWSYRICSDDMNWSGNMFDFYTLVYKRVEPLMPKPFIVKEDKNVGSLPGKEALREAIANALSNYAVMLGGGLTILLSGDKLTLRNMGRIKVGLQQALIGGKTNPRNAQVLTFFRLLDISDKAGTGIPKIFQIAKELSLSTPLLEEKAYPEETSLTIFLRQINDKKLLGSSAKDIISFISKKADEGASSKELEDYFKVSRTFINNTLTEMEKNNLIRSNGKRTNGRKYYLK